VTVTFVRRGVDLAPGSALAYDATAWSDTIVFVTAGVIELECETGERCIFERGDILCFASLSLRRLSNPGVEPARLLAVRRRRAG
jgi:hypothetical protein